VTYRTRSRTIGLLLVVAALAAGAASAQEISDVAAFVVAQSYPQLGSGVTASDPVLLLVVGKGCVHPVGGVPRDGNTFTVTLESLPPPPILPVPCSTFVFDFFLDRLAAGTYQVRVVGDGQLLRQSSFLVAPPSPALAVDGTSYLFELQFALPGAAPQAAYGVALGAFAGYFWFFAPGSPEVQVRLIDGRPLNGHRWLFVASSTTLEFDLIVKACPPVDPLLCFEVERYHQAPGRHAPILDFAFD
jgi:hypothetical protein